MSEVKKTKTNDLFFLVASVLRLRVICTSYELDELLKSYFLI